jgi:hypothetical protein
MTYTTEYFTNNFSRLKPLHLIRIQVSQNYLTVKNFINKGVK